MNRNLERQNVFSAAAASRGALEVLGYSSISSPNEQDLANLQEAPSETDASEGYGAP
jgi:hypothetical protein